MSPTEAMQWLKDLEVKIDRSLRVSFEPYGKWGTGWYCVVERTYDPDNKYKTIIASGSTPEEALVRLVDSMRVSPIEYIIAQL